MGIEPTSEAWEASVLPLYDARSLLTVHRFWSLRNCCAMSFSLPRLGDERWESARIPTHFLRL